jgi:hypothetical protein
MPVTRASRTPMPAIGSAPYLAEPASADRLIELITRPARRLPARVINRSLPSSAYLNRP